MAQENAYFGETIKSGAGMLAAVDLSAARYKAVTVGTSGVSLVSTTGAAQVKVLMNGPKAGSAAALVDFGETRAMAGAAIARGAVVMTDNLARFVTYVNNGVNTPVGEARIAASAAGDIITIFLWAVPQFGSGGTPPTLFSAVAGGTPLTLLAANMAGAQDVTVNLTAALAGAGTVTTDTAVNLIAAAALVGLGVGDSFKLRIQNSSSGAFAWTLVGGVGVTANGTLTMAQNTYRDFYVTISTATTVTMQSRGTGTGP